MYLGGAPTGFFLDATLSPRFTAQKAHTICVGLYPTKPLCAGGKRVPALPVYAVPVSPVVSSKSATLLYSQNLTCLPSTRFLISCICTPPGLAHPAAFIPARRFAAEVWFRTSLCGQKFSGSHSHVASCHRAALLIGCAALLTAFRLAIAFCLRRAFTGGSDPVIWHRWKVLTPHLAVLETAVLH